MIVSRNQPGDFVYLGCPYSSDDSEEVLDRFRRVNRAAGILMDLGYIVFSPITHSHTIEVAMERVKPWSYWQVQDYAILERCDGLFVLKLPGWGRSVGLNDEIDFAEAHDMHVTYIDPKDLNV